MNGNGALTKLGELNNNGAVLQLEAARADAKAARDAKEEYREVLIKLNRMLGGDGWERLTDVIGRLQSFIDKHSTSALSELSQQVAQADATERALRFQLQAESGKSDMAQRTARELRDKLKIAEKERILLHNECAMAKRERDAWKEKAEAPTVSAKVGKAMSDEERDALLTMLEMGREDYTALQQDVLRACADAAEEAREAELPRMTGSRSIRYFNHGLLLGTRAVEAAVVRVITNTPTKDKTNG